jgi:hypothetical protein
MSKREPTLFELESYKNYLIRKDTINKLNEYLKDLTLEEKEELLTESGIPLDLDLLNYDHVDFEGDNEYNDEGGYYYSLHSCTLNYNSGKLFLTLDYGNADTLFYDLSLESPVTLYPTKELPPYNIYLEEKE